MKLSKLSLSLPSIHDKPMQDFYEVKGKNYQETVNFSETSRN